MRLVKVAKALGMTGQQLRHELEQVNFGVKPTDREVSDTLAQGIIRFVARKHKIDVDMEALGFEDDGEEGEQGKEEGETSEAEEQEEAAPREGAVPLTVLRKLTLEGVSKEAIAKEEKKLKKPAKAKPTKAELEAQQEEEKVMSSPKKKTQHQEQIKKKEGVVTLPAQVTVKELGEKLGVQIPKVIQALMKNGVMATVTQSIDYDTAAIVASELGVNVEKSHEVASAEDILSRNLEELLKDEPENLQPRPPIVVVMGHVDHGKTAILDAIRQTDVVSGEAGGITQHIGAYQVEHTPKGSKEKHPITFLDTPGHEAFTAMRARGAQITDVAILVVSAEEGVKPTTVEAIDHVKDAGVPFIIAVNKIDKENANPDKVKGELAGHGLQTEDWGGKIPFVHTSAVTKQGIEELLDSIVLVSEMENLKANPNRPAVATVIESHLDPSLGPLATVIVNTGTLRVGDAFVCGAASGKIRAMMDAHAKRLEDIPPSGAVRVSGFDSVPGVGDVLQVVPSEQEARRLAESVKEQGDLLKKRSFADLVSRLSEGKLRQLKVVLKADTQGSLQALQEALAKQGTAEVSVKVIHAAIGAVTESDVMMAAASDGVVVAFHADASSGVMRTAEREGVEVRKYDVVYALLDDIEGLVKGLVEPVEGGTDSGAPGIRGVFLTKKKEQIVGGKVISGSIKRLPFRLFRGEGEEPVGQGRITSLKHVDKDIKEAKEGQECGARVESTIPVEEGDVLEVFLRELKKKE